MVDVTEAGGRCMCGCERETVRSPELASGGRLFYHGIPGLSPPGLGT